MDSLQILEILSRFQSHTVGVFPADQILRVWSKPTALVVNTGDHKRPDMHWVAVYVNKSCDGLYFDSFGIPPVIPDHINRLRKNFKSFRWNTVQLQSDTDVCGQYCIMFLSYMCKGLGFEKFLDNFSKNLVKNDDIVRSFVQYKNVDANFLGNSGRFFRYIQRGSSKMSLL